MVPSVVVVRIGAGKVLVSVAAASGFMGSQVKGM
jgi:hypothetical protein